MIRTLQEFQNFQIVSLNIEIAAVELPGVPSFPELSSTHGRNVPIDGTRA